MVEPPIHITDNLQLEPRAYGILLKGVEIARGELLPEHCLAINPGSAQEDIGGSATLEPAFGLEARWIKPAERERAQGACAPGTPCETTELVEKHAASGS